MVEAVGCPCEGGSSSGLVRAEEYVHGASGGRAYLLQSELVGGSAVGEVHHEAEGACGLEHRRMVEAEGFEELAARARRVEQHIG